MKDTGLNKRNINHQLIIAACGRLITEEDWTAREVMELLEGSKSQLFPALRDLEEEAEWK